MAQCGKNIDILAKSGGNSAVVSVRPKELISNLRALVAVRFEQAIDHIVLVFGGQVLRDEGTIDGHGITSGVIVHVIFRQAPKEVLVVETNRNTEQSPSSRIVDSKNNLEIFKPLLDDPGVLRELLLDDPRIKAMMDENVSLRHYLSNDRNLLEMFSTFSNPAKIKELERKRDMHILRMEWLPGGYHMLDRLNYHMRQVHEENVALTYQETEAGSCNRYAGNPQRGCENKMPLPNPWVKIKSEKSASRCTPTTMRMLIDLMQMMQREFRKTMGFDENPMPLADTETEPAKLTVTVSRSSAATSTTESLDLHDFMTCNVAHWEIHFSSQLLQLNRLGHKDRQQNICALLMSFGSVRLAINLLKMWKRTSNGPHQI